MLLCSQWWKQKAYWRYCANPNDTYNIYILPSGPEGLCTNIRRYVYIRNDMRAPTMEQRCSRTCESAARSGWS